MHISHEFIPHIPLYTQLHTIYVNEANNPPNNFSTAETSYKHQHTIPPTKEGTKTYRRRIPNQRRRLIHKRRRQQRVRAINHILELINIIAREQLGDVGRVVAAQEHGAAFDDGLEVGEGVVA